MIKLTELSIQENGRKEIEITGERLAYAYSINYMNELKKVRYLEIYGL